MQPQPACQNDAECKAWAHSCTGSTSVAGEAASAPGPSNKAAYTAATHSCPSSSCGQCSCNPHAEVGLDARLGPTLVLGPPTLLGKLPLPPVPAPKLHSWPPLLPQPSWKQCSCNPLAIMVLDANWGVPLRWATNAAGEAATALGVCTSASHMAPAHFRPPSAESIAAVLMSKYHAS